MSVAEVNYSEFPVDCLKPWGKNPRKPIADGDLVTLVHSVRQHGVIEPLIVRETSDPLMLEIVCGERRWRAATAAGIEAVPVRSMGVLDDQQAMLLSLVENIERSNLDPIEEAEALHRMNNELGMTQREIAVLLGRSQPLIASRIRLLRLPNEVKDLIRQHKLSASHGVSIVRFTASHDVMRWIADKAVRYGEGSKLLDAQPLPHAADLADHGLVRYVSPTACRFDVRQCQDCPFAAFVPLGSTAGWCLHPPHWEDLTRAAGSGVPTEQLPSSPPVVTLEPIIRPVRGHEPTIKPKTCPCCGQPLPMEDAA